MHFIRNKHSPWINEYLLYVWKYCFVFIWIVCCVVYLHRAIFVTLCTMCTLVYIYRWRKGAPQLCSGKPGWPCSTCWCAASPWNWRGCTGSRGGLWDIRTKGGVPRRCLYHQEIMPLAFVTIRYLPVSKIRVLVWFSPYNKPTWLKNFSLLFIL